MRPTLESSSLVTGTGQAYPIELAPGYPAKNFTGQERVTRSPASRCGHTSTLDLPSPLYLLSTDVGRLTECCHPPDRDSTETPQAPAWRNGGRGIIACAAILAGG